MAHGEDDPDSRWQPEVRAWLARLESEAAVLPESRRTELRAEVEDYLAEAVRDAAPGPDRDAAAARALTRLGPPAALVAEAGGYPVSPVDAQATRPDDEPATPGPPWLEVTTISLLAASVILALVPATEAVAPVPWFVGTVLVLLSRRWTAGDKALAVGAFGVLGVPLILLGRDELPPAASVVVSVLLVVGWLAAAVRLLARARVPRDQEQGLRMR